MKFAVISICFAVSNTLCAQMCKAVKTFVITRSQCESGDWVLVFEDNFNTGVLDLSKWKIPYQGVIRDFENRNEKQWYANSANEDGRTVQKNIEFTDSTIRLIAGYEDPPLIGTYTIDYSTTPWTTKTDTFYYSSAQIESQESFGYGKYEIRCKIPKGKQLWPAFWMYGERNGVNSEIDVFEYWDNNSRRHHISIHYNKGFCTTSYRGSDFSKTFHVFTVVWDPYKLEFYVDGKLKKSRYKYYNMTGRPVECRKLDTNKNYLVEQVFPVPSLNILANLAIQTGSTITPGDRVFPAVFEIDYIRYFRRSP